MSKQTIRYEDAAEQRTTTLWCCRACGRGYSEERVARWCCGHKDQPCKCGGRIHGSWTVCDACKQKNRDAKWDALERVEWDGGTPLYVWDDDKYLFDEDAVRDYLADCVADGHAIEDVRLVVCRLVKPPTFEMSSLLSDYLGEDDRDIDATEIEKTVNDWIESNVPDMWEAGGNAVSAESLKMLMEG